MVANDISTNNAKYWLLNFQALHYYTILEVGEKYLYISSDLGSTSSFTTDVSIRGYPPRLSPSLPPNFC